jgi:hypothetical protein
MISSRFWAGICWRSSLQSCQLRLATEALLAGLAFPTQNQAHHGSGSVQGLIGQPGLACTGRDGPLQTTHLLRDPAFHVLTACPAHGIHLSARGIHQPQGRKRAATGLDAATRRKLQQHGPGLRATLATCGMSRLATLGLLPLSRMLPSRGL